VNAGFILGLVFVPGLWECCGISVPAAMIALPLIAVLAFRQIGSFPPVVCPKAKRRLPMSPAHNQTPFCPTFRPALRSWPTSERCSAAMSTGALTVGISLHRVHHRLETYCPVLYRLGWPAITAFKLNVASWALEGERATLLGSSFPILTVLGHPLAMRQEHAASYDLRRTMRGRCRDNLLLTTTILAVQGCPRPLALLVLKRQKNMRNA